MFPLPSDGSQSSHGSDAGSSYPTIGDRSAVPGRLAPGGSGMTGTCHTSPHSRKTLPIVAGAVIACVAAVAVTIALTRSAGENRAEAGSAPTGSKSTATTQWAPGSTLDPRPRTTTPIASPRPDASRVALSVSVPISQPECDGSGIVVLRSAVTPGNYGTEIQRYLNEFPGASYLRTDHSCPSLRQSTASGDPIYAVYRPAGRTEAEICSEVRRAGGDAYGKWLDMTTDPGFMITC